MSRDAHLGGMRQAARVDVAVIGGGATGLGIALDAAARGWRVALFEAQDFAQGTSSRSTKLLHGGVRYLAQGHWPLVREALHERATALAHAPHIAQPLPFVVPGYRWWHPAFYGLGLSLYSLLAGQHRLGRTRWLTAAQVRQCAPTLEPRGLCGGVSYWDGQFDDARFAIALARTAAAHGALLLNHCPVTALMQHAGRVTGVTAKDSESGLSFTLDAACVINATGVWVDAVERLADPTQAQSHIRPSQGVHLVVDRDFLPAGHAVLVPRTRDGRVLFAIPWLGKTLLGTTDTPRSDAPLEPQATTAEVDFILGEAAQILRAAPTRSDVRSIWVGLRPLVTAPHAQGATATLSREHSIWSDATGLISISGGKWTTYRAMAEDVIRHGQRQGLLPLHAGVTATLPLWGCPGSADLIRPLSDAPGAHSYGSDQQALRQLPGADVALWKEDGQLCLSEAMVRHAVRAEMARTVGDVLARRCRLLFLDARRAHDLAPRVGELMTDELGLGFDRERSVTEFQTLAQHYLNVP